MKVHDFAGFKRIRAEEAQEAKLPNSGCTYCLLSFLFSYFDRKERYDNGLAKSLASYGLPNASDGSGVGTGKPPQRRNDSKSAMPRLAQKPNPPAA